MCTEYSVEFPLIYTLCKHTFSCMIYKQIGKHSNSLYLLTVVMLHQEAVALCFFVCVSITVALILHHFWGVFFKQGGDLLIGSGPNYMTHYSWVHPGSFQSNICVEFLADSQAFGGHFRLTKGMCTRVMPLLLTHQIPSLNQISFIVCIVYCILWWNPSWACLRGGWDTNAVK